MEVRMIPIDKIRPAPFQPRETFEKEKIAELAESIKVNDLISPILVRKEGNSYQIIAGERRWRAWHDIGIKEIPAIIREANTLESMELSLIENWQREDLSTPESEKFIYQLWQNGKKAERYKNIPDMARKTGISVTTLGRIISAGDEKHGKNVPWNIKRATARDLQETRVLKEIAPEAREELLKFRVEEPEKLTTVEMREVVKVIKEAPEDRRRGIVKLIAEEKLEPKEVESFVKTLKEAPEDIREKLIKQEITPEEAEEVKIFKQPAQREQFLRERQMIKEEHEKEQEVHKTIRVEQARAVEQGKPMIEKVDTDEIDSDKRMVERYRDVYLKAIVFRSDHIGHMNDDRMKEQCISWVRKTYEHCYKVLVELEEIKTV